MRCVRVRDVGRVVVEGRQRADRRDHDRHRMGVAAKALEEAVHLVVHHRVARDPVVEIRLLGRGRQLAVEQEIAGLEEVAMLGELLDRVAAIEQDALVAVDIGDLRLAGGGRGEAGIVGEHPGLGVELRDVDDARADRPVLHRELELLVVDDEGARSAIHGMLAFRHVACAQPSISRWTMQDRCPVRASAASE